MSTPNTSTVAPTTSPTVRGAQAAPSASTAGSTSAALAVGSGGYSAQSDALRPGGGQYDRQANSNRPRGASGAAPAAVSASEPGVATTVLNLRRAPSTDAAVLTMIPKDAAVTILERGVLAAGGAGGVASWTKLLYGAQVGYGASDYVRTGAAPARVTPIAADAASRAPAPVAGPGRVGSPGLTAAPSPVAAPAIAAVSAAATAAGPAGVSTAAVGAVSARAATVPAVASPAATTPATATPAAATPAAATPTAATPDEAAAPAVVTSTSQERFGPTPWIWNQWLPENGGGGSQEFKFHSRLFRAASALRSYPAILAKAEQASAAASAKLDAAKAAEATLAAAAASHTSPAAKLADKKAATAAAIATRAAKAVADKATAALKQARALKTAIDTELAASQADFKAWLKPTVKARYTRMKRLAEWAAVEEEIDAYDPIQSYTQTTYTVTMDGKSVALTEHTQAYATELAEGLGGTVRGDNHAGVDAAVDRTRFGADDKQVMKSISKHEGTFTTTESYDIGGLTWGFLQWTTGLDGRGSVLTVMNKLKALDPAAYTRWFTNNGIDVKGGALIVKRAGGVELSGAAAVREIRTDPVLSAAFALSATDPAVQNAQLEVAKTHKMDRDGLERSVTVVVANKPYTFKARDVFTSEWGAALVANGGVHAGPVHVDQSLRSGLTAFFAKNPKLDPAKPATWAGLAETFIAPRLIAGDSYRAKAFEKDGLSKTPGSYDGSIPKPAAKK